MTRRHATNLALALAVAGGAMLAGCVSLGPKDAADERPAWIGEPGDGVSAAAGEHIHGRVAQEELAIARARDELARRMGVRVSNVMSSELTVAGQTAVSSAQSQSTQQVTGAEVTAAVRAKWLDRSSGLLWVWLVPVK
jgi:hypothetical protein